MSIYLDRIYMAARMEGMEEGRRVAIHRLTELLDRTSPEYVWIRQQIESTIKQIQDARPSDNPRTG